MKVLDLFSGIGGFSLGLERAGMETVAFCEIEDYPRQVLAKHWPGVFCHQDIRALDGKQYRNTVDVICGGFPCQPFSTAGKQRGEEDHRHLWPEMLRVISQCEPNWVIGENVANFANMGLDQCISDLEGQGYAVEAFIIPACAVGAPHRRDRVWIVAHSRAWGSSGGWSEPKHGKFGPLQEELAHLDGNGCDQRRERKRPTWCDGIKRNHRWPTESELRGGVHGVPNRVDRIKALGNAVVPQIPEIIGRAIMELEATW